MKFSTEPLDGLRVRGLVWDVLRAVAAGSYSDVALKRIFSTQNLTPLDKGFVTELAYGAIRQRYFLDCWIDFLGKVPALKQPPLLRWLLHVGLYQVFFMNRIPDSAIVNTTVELSKRSSLNKLSSVVNGILRSAIRAKKNQITLPVPNNIEDRIAQSESIPKWLARELIVWQGEEKAEHIAKSFNRVPLIDIRVNRILSNKSNIKKLFFSAGISSVDIKDCPYGMQIQGRSGDIRNWPGYVEGKWCVQDRSAQWVSPLLDPKPNDRILDACSAPGGKATHLAELINDKGEIWAVDKSKKRLHQVLLNANRLNLTCLKFLQADSCELLQHKPYWKNYFQKILIDAPCSGLGTLARNPDARWRISNSAINELVQLQAKLLDRLFPLLAEGGRIVYSTCTINPNENQLQINTAQHPTNDRP